MPADPHGFARLGGLLSVAIASGDTTRIAAVEQQLAVARAIAAIERHLAGCTITPEQRAAIVAALP